MECGGVSLHVSLVQALRLDSWFCQVQVPSKEKCRTQQHLLTIAVERGASAGDTVIFAHRGGQQPKKVPGPSANGPSSRAGRRLVQRAVLEPPVEHGGPYRTQPSASQRPILFERCGEASGDFHLNGFGTTTICRLSTLKSSLCGFHRFRPGPLGQTPIASLSCARSVHVGVLLALRRCDREICGGQACR